MDLIEQCIVERARHEQELQNRLKSLNERKLQIQECKVQEVKASDANMRDKDSSGIVSDTRNAQSLKNQSNTSRDKSSRSRIECNDKSTSRDDTDIRPSYDTEPMVEVPYIAEYNVFAVETQHSEQPENINDISLMEKIDSNTTPNSSDMCNNEFKDDQNADERDTNRTLGESNRTRDICFVALHDKEIELAKYKTFKDHTIKNDTLERKVKETQAALAQKEHDIKEGLKLKAYEIFVVKQKHDVLVKQSLLTESHYEGLVKEKTKVITYLKQKEENDLDKLIAMEKQLNFLNEIVYKRNQSSQTIHMLAPKGSTFNGRPTFANLMYLKKAQSEKPCLYEIPYDTLDLANRFIPDREETLILEQESRSKLNKDLVKPYDYTKKDGLYEIFKPTSQEYHVQLAHANENLLIKLGKHILMLAFVPPTALDMEVLIKTCLMPLVLKTQNDSFIFVHELKHEMHADLKYVESLEKEIDKLQSDKAEFSNMYIYCSKSVCPKMLCVIICIRYLLDAHNELQCLYLHKVKECECLAQKLFKKPETVCKDVYNELS
ncbi:hypothetical protein Tco_0828337 [Tanacetum coccineum]